ncbi:MAG: hypothetical protein ABSH32_30770 [Bryobacteraceae bacterium]|jgi:hypothetical protein
MKANHVTVAALTGVVWVALFAAAARTQEVAPPASDIPPDKSVVIIYVLPGEGANKFAPDVEIDHKVAVCLRKGVFFRTTLEPGKHDFRVAGPYGKSYTFRLDPGQETYLRLVQRIGASSLSLRTFTRFEMVTPEHGKLDVSQGALHPPAPKDLRLRKK